MRVLWGLVALAAILVVAGIVIYNRIVAMRQLTRNAWSDVDVYLKRRAELVPNLVSAIKGYMTHEQGTLERVVQARQQALGSPGATHERANAEAELSSGIQNVTILAEGYPDLKASESFLSLQAELSETERLIASARQYYNACVRDYNTMLEAFPGNIVAGSLGLKTMDFFEVDTLADRQSPGVQLP